MSHETRLKQVREAFDASVLATICMAEESYFEKYGSKYKKDGGKGKFAFFCKDDVSDVLGIAHMDSVQKAKDFGVAKYVSGKELVMSPTLDDRLGIYVICELLPKLGVKTDILLTTDEESGNSSAKHFETTKKYKWMFQFDRTGDDVVMYQYDTPELRTKLVDAGFKCASGSASDISKLGDLGCSGMNFGVGYYDYHWERAYADLNVMFDQVAKFLKFYSTNRKTHLVYDKTVTKTTTHYPSSSWSGMGGVYSPDFENDHSRRVGGTHYSKMIWDEKLRLYVPNRYLFKNFPTTQLPSWDKMCDANERWSTKLQGWELADGKMTEDEVYEAIVGVLKDIGHGDFERGPREKRQFSQQSILESEDDDSPKSLPGASSNGSLSGESISGSLSDDPDKPCRCGHSQFVHNRTIWRKGGHVIANHACDWWKCSCAGFEDIETVWPDDSTVGMGV
jgi:hypothetical protein